MSRTERMMFVSKEQSKNAAAWIKRSRRQMQAREREAKREAKEAELARKFNVEEGD